MDAYRELVKRGTYGNWKRNGGARVIPDPATKRERLPCMYRVSRLTENGTSYRILYGSASIRSDPSPREDLRDTSLRRFNGRMEDRTRSGIPDRSASIGINTPATG